MTTFQGNDMAISLDPNGRVNMETKAAEEEAADNYDPFTRPN